MYRIGKSGNVCVASVASVASVAKKMPFLDDLRKRLEGEQRLTAKRVCEILTEQWGGERVYIGKRGEKPQISHTDTPKTLMDRTGTSRATAYRRLRKNWVAGWK